MDLQEKLLNIQINLKATKDLKNNFGGYTYRSCESILESLKPLLKEYKCIVALNDDIVLIGDRYYIKASATITDIESKETLTTTAFAREEENKKGMDSSQVTGASSSYARKYALNGLFAIDDNKDSDSTNTHEIKLTESQVKRVYAIAYKKGIKKELVDNQVMKKFNKKVADLSKEEYETVCKGYESMKEGVK